MNIYAKKGAKVEYTGMGGYDYHKFFANRYLKVGEIYTVFSTNVGKWHTDVYLEEFPNKAFNSVQFKDVK